MGYRQRPDGGKRDMSYRVVTLRRVKTPDHWGVVERIDGKDRLLAERFWRKSDAVAYAAIKRWCSGLTDDVLERQP